MNFTYCEFPSTVSFNTFKAYFNPNAVQLPKLHTKSMSTIDFNESASSVPVPAAATNLNTTSSTTTTTATKIKTLRHLVLDAIANNWSELPIYKEIPRREDRNYLLSILDVNITLKLLSTHIRDDFFWQKCYQQRWKTYPTFPVPYAITTKTPAKQCVKPRWISIYMERHLQEFIEKLQPHEYELEQVQTQLDICAAYINQLHIDYLQPGKPDGQMDHIPLDYILSNLPELHTLRLTYCTKTVGTHYYLGCNTLTQTDIILLARGLSRSHELLDFRLHNTKLEPYQLRLLAHSLDKGCHKLTHLSLAHTGFGDDGIRNFLESCTKESFRTLQTLDLTNNKICAYVLSRTVKQLCLKTLILRMNPIESDGAAAIFSMLNYLPIETLDIGGCCMNDNITKLFMVLIIKNKTIRRIDISNNQLGEEFGRNIYKIIGFNKQLQLMDLRNTDITLATRNKIKAVCDENKKECNKQREEIAKNL